MKKRDNGMRKTAQTLTLITQLGLVMISAVGMMTALGIWLDRILGTNFLTVICFFFGALGGINGARGMIRQIFGDDKNERKPSSAEQKQEEKHD